MANQKSNSQSVVAFASVKEMSLKIRQKSQLKGRQADEASLQEVRALLLLDAEALKQRRDLLIDNCTHSTTAFAACTKGTWWPWPS